MSNIEGNIEELFGCKEVPSWLTGCSEMTIKPTGTFSINSHCTDLCYQTQDGEIISIMQLLWYV